MRRKAAENAIAWGTDDPFDYALAIRLRMTHSAIQALPHDEYVRWRAYMIWENAQRQLAADTARARGR